MKWNLILSEYEDGLIKPPSRERNPMVSGLYVCTCARPNADGVTEKYTHLMAYYADKNSWCDPGRGDDVCSHIILAWGTGSVANFVSEPWNMCDFNDFDVVDGRYLVRKEYFPEFKGKTNREIMDMKIAAEEKNNIRISREAERELGSRFFYYLKTGMLDEKWVYDLR